MGSLSLLQGTFLTHGSNLGPTYCRRILYPLSHKGSPRILEWVAYSFSSDLPHPGIKPRSPAFQAGFLPTELSGKSLKFLEKFYIHMVLLILKVKVEKSEVAQSCRLFATPWIVVYQAPLSMGFSSQEYWGGLPFPSPGDLPNPGIEPGSPTL